MTFIVHVYFLITEYRCDTRAAPWQVCRGHGWR